MSEALRRLSSMTGRICKRAGEIVAGYVAGAICMALVLNCFQAARDGLTLHEVPAFALIALLPHILAFGLVPKLLIFPVVISEILGVRTVFFYVLAWGLIGRSIAGLDQLPGLDWFQRNGDLMWFLGGLPGGVAYWFFAGRFTSKRIFKWLCRVPAFLYPPLPPITVEVHRRRAIGD